MSRLRRFGSGPTLERDCGLMAGRQDHADVRVLGCVVGNQLFALPLRAKICDLWIHLSLEV